MIKVDKLMFFNPTHLIYPVQKEVLLRFEPQYPLQLDDKINYSIQIKAFSGLKRITEGAECLDKALSLRIGDQTLSAKFRFPQEDRYICTLSANGEKVQIVEMYALNADLFGTVPYRGDNHMHSYFSDGKDSPMYMAAAACRHGCDYCAITDHKQFEPSLIAREYYKDVDLAFLILSGEEIHSPHNPVHIINLGGSVSVNDWWRDHEDEYNQEVARRLADVPEDMLQAQRFACAASQVIFDKIKEADGISVLCHPHWINGFLYNEAEAITDYLCTHRRFDALELIAGGAYEIGTQLQISYYHQMDDMPVLGSSDAHGCFGDHLEPGNYTIVFAKNFSPEGIKSAIRAGRTVAGDGNKLYGEYRLVKYAYFLLKNYYEAHNALSDRLGAEMIRYASGKKTQEMRQVLESIRPHELFGKLLYRE